MRRTRIGLEEIRCIYGRCTDDRYFRLHAGCRNLYHLYNDYERQMKLKKDPYYNPDLLSWKGVDESMWKDINKKYIEEDAKENA